MRLCDHPEMLKLRGCVTSGWDTSGWTKSSGATGPDIPSMNAWLTDVKHMDENAQRAEQLNLTAVEDDCSFRKTYENLGSRSFFRRLWHLLDKNTNKTLHDIQYLDVPDYETVEEFLRGRGGWSIRDVSWQTTGGEFTPTDNSKLYNVDTQEGFPRRLIVTVQTVERMPRGCIDTALDPKEMEALLAVLNKSRGLAWGVIAEKAVPFQEGP